ncbi:MAG: hypothetical protein ACP5NG_00855 [Conexivisphaera sp.]
MPSRVVVLATSTRDVVGGSERLGGPAFFVGTALHLLGSEALVITNAGRVADALGRLEGISVSVAGSDETVFSIEVDQEGGRILRLLRRSSMRSVELPDRGPFIISGTMGEIPIGLVEEAASRGPALVDVQGFVREADEGGEVRNSPDLMRDLMRRLRGSGVLLRGERYEFPPECRGEKLVDCSEDNDVDLVMTDAENPFYAAVGGAAYRGHPIGGLHGEPIGLGDVFTAALGYYMYSVGLDLARSAALSSAAATLKLRGKHPWFTPVEVEEAARKVRLERLR